MRLSTCLKIYDLESIRATVYLLSHYKLVYLLLKIDLKLQGRDQCEIVTLKTYAIWLLFHSRVVMHACQNIRSLGSLPFNIWPRGTIYRTLHLIEFRREVHELWESILAILQACFVEIMILLIATIVVDVPVMVWMERCVEWVRGVFVAYARVVNLAGTLLECPGSFVDVSVSFWKICLIAGEEFTNAIFPVGGELALTYLFELLHVKSG